MPKVTINEINNTTRLTASASNAGIRAIIGPATKGAINTPVECTNLTDFKTVFGEVAPEYNPYAYFGAIDSLRKGATVLFTRIEDGNAAAASKTIGSLIITADSVGTWGNTLSVKITSVSGSVGSYLLTVFDNNVAVESGIFTVESLLIEAKKLNYVTLSGAAGLTLETVIGETAVAQELTGGENGSAFFETLTDSADLTTMMTSFLLNLQTILTALTDTTWYAFSVLCIPGMCSYPSITGVSDVSITKGNTVVEQLKSFVAVRDDCVVILDPGKSDTPSNILTNLGLTGPQTQTHMSVFYPWYNATVDRTGKIMLLPPSLFYLNASALTQQVAKPWIAIAGPNAGVADNILSTTTLIGATTSDMLNNALINPISYNRNFGYFIDGNNVLNTTAVTRLYSQLNVRMAINYAKRAIAQVCEQLSYKNNSSITRADVLGRISAILIELQAGEAIYGYRAFINDSEYDRSEGKIHLTVKIYPTPALEEFTIDFEIVNSESAL